MAGGRLRAFGPAAAFPELSQGRLLALVERWLREEARVAAAARATQVAERAAAGGADAAAEEAAHAAEGQVAWNNGFSAGRLTSSLKLASNAVLRM